MNLAFKKVVYFGAHPSVARPYFVTFIMPPGVVRLKSPAQSHVRWPTMDANMEEVVKSCPIRPKVRKTPLNVPLIPWS